MGVFLIRSSHTVDPAWAGSITIKSSVVLLKRWKPFSKTGAFAPGSGLARHYIGAARHRPRFIWRTPRFQQFILIGIHAQHPAWRKSPWQTMSHRKSGPTALQTQCSPGLPHLQPS
ncbi:MAG TPA: hypothetical protein VGE56_09370, partial [Rhodocyclaceae bacterium]